MDPKMRSIAATAAATHGVFSRTAWTEAQLSERQLRHAITTGSVIRLGHRAFTFPGQPSTFEQRLTAALAEFPEKEHEGLAGGRSAARLMRLDVPVSDDVELSVATPYRNRGRSLPFAVRAHGRLNAVDRIDVEGFPSLSATRLIIEEAGRWPLSTIEAAIDSALRLGWTSPTFLTRRLEALRGPGKRGARLIDHAMQGAGGHNWLEREFLRLVRSAGLPTPTTQKVFRRDGRTVARVDNLWEELRLVVEVAGHATHSQRRHRQHDAQRQTELTAIGYRVTTFTYEDVAERSPWVVDQLRRLQAVAA